MRRPSRQLNIFSMSAIDLFASAMGAFVVIAGHSFSLLPETKHTQAGGPYAGFK